MTDDPQPATENRLEAHRQEVIAGIKDVAAKYWQIVLTDDPAQIAALREFTRGTQDDIVDQFIEETCWGEALPQFVGNKGTHPERLAALRAAYRAYEGGHKFW